MGELVKERPLMDHVLLQLLLLALQIFQHIPILELLCQQQHLLLQALPLHL